MDKYSEKEITPAYWFNKATDLKASAGVIWVAMQKEDSLSIVNELGLGEGFSLAIACWKTYFMLCGLSLELLFKSILLSKNIKIPTTHNLYELALLGELNYSQKEIEVLNILSEYIIWSGKYPIPKKREQFENFHNLHERCFWKGKKVGNIEILKPKDPFTWEIFNNIWKIGRKEYIG